MFQNAMCFVSILISLRCHLGIGLILGYLVNDSEHDAF